MRAYFDSNDGKPKVELEIMGNTGVPKKIYALIDTGHSDKLSLPFTDLVELGSVVKTRGPVEFGNGDRQLCMFFGVKVRKEANGPFEDVLASYLGSDEAIAGIELFYPYTIKIDLKKKEVTIENKEGEDLDL